MHFRQRFTTIAFNTPSGHKHIALNDTFIRRGISLTHMPYGYQTPPSQNADCTQSGSTDKRNTRIFQSNSTLPLKAALFVATTDHRYLDPAHIEQHTTDVGHTTGNITCPNCRCNIAALLLLLLRRPRKAIAVMAVVTEADDFLLQSMGGIGGNSGGLPLARV